MGKQTIGPREQQLREQREKRYGKSTATVPNIAKLKSATAALPEDQLGATPRPVKKKRKARL